MGSIAGNLQHVRQRIAAACAAAGRSENSVTLLAVSKSVPATITIELWVPSEPVVTRAGAVTKAMSLVAVPANPLHVANRNIGRGSPMAAPTFSGPTMSNEERFVIR